MGVVLLSWIVWLVALTAAVCADKPSQIILPNLSTPEPWLCFFTFFFSIILTIGMAKDGGKKEGKDNL